MPALCAEAISAGYGRAAIINDISLTADLGTVTTIIGPNGAGKSTFVKTLVGILRPMSGRIAVNDVDITRMPGYQIPRHGLVYVPQNDNVFKRLTVRENLEVGGFASRAKPGAAYGGDLQHLHRPRQSKGEESRFPFRRPAEPPRHRPRLMVDPAVILLDEPTAGLSPAYTDVVWNQIGRISQLNTAVVVVEQNVERALKHSDYVHIFVAGRNHVHGKADEIASLDLPSIFLGRSHAE